MIRDPSDGSVKEKPAIGIPITEQKQELDRSVSGLPAGSTKSKDLAKLEKSREWLKNYREGKSNARGNNDEKHSAPGNPSDQERLPES